MNSIGNWASLITILLFIFYIIGRIIRIYIEGKYIHEKIIWCRSNEPDIDKKYNIKEHICLDPKSKFGFVIMPKNSVIKKIKIYEYNDESNEKGKCIVNKNVFLNEEYGIFVQTDNPELLVNYFMVFKRIDGMTCKFKIRSNTKNGISEELIECHHNFWSVLYYLFT